MTNKVAKWINRYYKPERLNSEPGRRERIIADRENDLKLYGSALISKHDSVTGYAEELKADQHDIYDFLNQFDDVGCPRCPAAGICVRCGRHWQA